jgi:hypothetical protein
MGLPDLGREENCMRRETQMALAVRGVVLGEPFECVQLAASETWHF